jgi:hypothetical protein
MANFKFERRIDMTPHEGAATIIGNKADGSREVESSAFSQFIVGLAGMFPQLKVQGGKAATCEANSFLLITNKMALDFELTPNGSICIAVPASWLQHLAATYC